VFCFRTVRRLEDLPRAERIGDLRDRPRAERRDRCFEGDLDRDMVLYTKGKKKRDTL